MLPFFLLLSLSTATPIFSTINKEAAFLCGEQIQLSWQAPTSSSVTVFLSPWLPLVQVYEQVNPSLAIPVSLDQLLSFDLAVFDVSSHVTGQPFVIDDICEYVGGLIPGVPSEDLAIVLVVDGNMTATYPFVVGQGLRWITPQDGSHVSYGTWWSILVQAAVAASSSTILQGWGTPATPTARQVSDLFHFSIELKENGGLLSYIWDDDDDVDREVGVPSYDDCFLSPLGGPATMARYAPVRCDSDEPVEWLVEGVPTALTTSLRFFDDERSSHRQKGDPDDVDVRLIVDVQAAYSGDVTLSVSAHSVQVNFVEPGDLCDAPLVSSVLSARTYLPQEEPVGLPFQPVAWCGVRGEEDGAPGDTVPYRLALVERWVADPFHIAMYTESPWLFSRLTNRPAHPTLVTPAGLDDATPTLFVAVRGSIAPTESTDEWINNLDYGPTTCAAANLSVCGDEPLHAGFVRELLATRPILDDVLSRIPAEQPLNILLTGHSQGGAIAHLLALYLATTRGDAVRVVSLAAPSITPSETLRTLFNNMFDVFDGYDERPPTPRALTVRLADDLVPFLPLGWQSLGNIVNFRRFKLSAGLAHATRSYTKALSFHDTPARGFTPILASLGRASHLRFFAQPILIQRAGYTDAGSRLATADEESTTVTATVAIVAASVVVFLCCLACVAVVALTVVRRKRRRASHRSYRLPPHGGAERRPDVRLVRSHSRRKSMILP